MIIIKCFPDKLLQITQCLNLTSLRWYRFGNRVTPYTGYYYSPKHEAEQNYLPKNQVEDKLDMEELRKKRNVLFDEEKKRQSDLVARIEKIEVKVSGIPEAICGDGNVTLLMNKNISTPFNCAQHIHQLLVDRSVLAEIIVDGQDGKNDYFDMHRPLEKDCELRLRHFREENNSVVNKAFWRSCSFLMGMVVEKAFKQDINVFLHSWPKPDLKSGSFIYDVAMNLDNWKPKEAEIRVLTSMLWKIVKEDGHFERMEVKSELAKDIFEHNPIKAKQVDDIASSSAGRITLYRLGDHIDMSVGPMIARTSQIGTIMASAVHPIQLHNCNLYRFQGIALPKQLNLRPISMNILRERARKLNLSGLEHVTDHNDVKEKIGSEQNREIEKNIETEE